MAGRDLGPHSGCGAGVLVQCNQHGVATGVDCRDSISPSKTARAMKSG
jgi:hypothetical protein